MCDLPLPPVPFDVYWKHLFDIQLADPTFRHPCLIDILLGVDIFMQVLLHDRWLGPPGSPATFKTELVGFLLVTVLLVILPFKLLLTMLQYLQRTIFYKSLGKPKSNGKVLYVPRGAISRSPF